MKTPPIPFTMTEFINENGLGVSPQDRPAVQMISRWLREHGFRRTRRRRRGKVEVCWDNDTRLDGLKEKLR